MARWHIMILMIGACQIVQHMVWIGVTQPILALYRLLSQSNRYIHYQHQHQNQDLNCHRHHEYRDRHEYHGIMIIINFTFRHLTNSETQLL